MKMPREREEPVHIDAAWDAYELPAALRRDTNNRAPFMDPPLKIGLDGGMSIGGRTVVGVVLDPFWK